MLKRAAIEFYGTQKALAEALDITSSAISQWGDYVPYAHQIYLQQLSDGALLAVRRKKKRLVTATVDAQASPAYD